MSDEKKAMDLEDFENRLDRRSGREYWRSIEELADPERRAELAAAGEYSGTDGVDRRDFLRVMGASLAMAGATACDFPPAESIVPYVRQPEEIIPGKPLYYATSMTLSGATTGLLVESHMGRPTKIEGNPKHPASLGSSDRHAQGALLNLYDPDRAQTVRRAGQIDTWGSFVSAMLGVLAGHETDGGEGLRLLTGTIVSPTLADQIRQAATKYPNLKWHQWDSAAVDSGRAGRERVFGEQKDVVLHLDRADVVVSIDADVLDAGAGHLRYARDFASRRRVGHGSETMNRLYAVESTPGCTGAVADHRLPLRVGEMSALVASLASAVGVDVVGTSSPGGRYEQWAAIVARDLRAHAGASVVVAGDQLSADIHVMVYGINEALGNSGSTIEYVTPAPMEPVYHTESLRELVTDMAGGRVSGLLVLGCNPVYDSPADLQFAGAMEKVPFRAHLSPYYDETSERCHWHVPECHFLESWSDARSWDGTCSIVQPLIRPLYRSRSSHEVLALFSEGVETSPHDLVRRFWGARRQDIDFEKWWRRALHDGVIPRDDSDGLVVSIPDLNVSGLTPPAGESGPSGDGLEVIFRPDPNIHDGTFANNGWLQELPKPLTKLTWDNAALMSPSTASRLGVESEDVIEITLGGRAITAPAWILPGHADEAVTVHLGYGRTRAGRVGTGAGFNASLLRTSNDFHFATGASITKQGKRTKLACTQRHHSMEGRDLVRSMTVDEFQGGSNGHGEHGDMSLYPGWDYEGYAWGLSIDTSVCIGCSGCTIACQAENNIPVVGKREVIREREMHWIRVDHYYSGDPTNPETLHQPVPCMHCESAPCEPVCPVEATSHSDEGLNDMTYNRCVGTRYCSNNCPYKVRRFNFFEYSDFETESLKLMRNPDVTVRQRGVMEKCTYCVQRINSARIDAEKEGRKVRDGEIVTACQQACPTQAIVFGDINDPSSRVAKAKHEPHDYSLLGELNTRPRTTYLATVRNPNPEVEST